MSEAERIMEIKARTDAATRGEWQDVGKSVRVSNSDTKYGAPNGYCGGICNCLGGDYQSSSKSKENLQARANAEFIAHAKQGIPWLLEQLEALRVQEQNEPLTLEQAIIRIGDAVWLRLKIPGEYDGWRFLIGESGSYFVFTLASGRKEMYLKETIGSDYNLYAHEPKGADHE